MHRQLLAQDPQLLPVAGPPTNLPRRATTFVSRTAEIGAGRRCGPQRTAGDADRRRRRRQVAAGAGGGRRGPAGFPDGVWLVSWRRCPTAARSATPSPRRCACSSGTGCDDRADASSSTCAGRRLLLVLDNCEHVLDAAARLRGRARRECPGVVVLATSREALGVAGEQVWPVPPLAGRDAAALFVQRARATRPDFDPDGRSGAVAEICRRLDGLPLAIELAAARMRAMSAAEMAPSGCDDARLLARGPRTAQPRHQSLAAAIDWSYRLLSEPEQRLFARMSVFAGGADLARVHAVCAEPGDAEADTLDLVTALVDKSMVVASSDPGVTRYRMLETLRAYGRERLPQDDGLARRHAALLRRCSAGGGRPRRAGRRRARLGGADDAGRGQPAGGVRAGARRRATSTWPCALVTALPEVLHVRRGYEAGGLGRAGAGAAPAGPSAVRRRGRRGRPWRLERRRLRPGPPAGRPGRRAASPARGTARIGAIPPTSSPTSPCTRATSRPPLAHYTAEVAAARRDDDPVRLVWTLYYVAVCHAVRRTPEPGSPRPRRAWPWRRRPPIRPRGRWPVTRSGWC